MPESNYHEPWSFAGTPGSADEHLVNTQNKSLFWVWKNFYFADRKEIERMAACVNFCAGVTNEELAAMGSLELLNSTAEGLRVLVASVSDLILPDTEGDND